MSLKIDTSRALRTHRELHDLVLAVEQATAEDESEWIEWKSRLDLSAKSTRATLARHIIGMANRRVDEAERFVGGFGYILVGIEPGNRHGVDRVDFAELQAGIASYLGPYGPTWTARYDDEGGPATLILIVDPPRYGDPIHTLHRDFERYHAGDIYVRKLGSTEKADPADIQILTERKYRKSGSRVTGLTSRPRSVIAAIAAIAVAVAVIYRLTPLGTRSGDNRPSANSPAPNCPKTAGSSLAKQLPTGATPEVSRVTYMTSLLDPKYTPSSISFSPDGSTLADASVDPNSTGVFAGAGRGTMYLWNLKTRKSASVPDPDGSPLYSTAYAPNGKTLATSDGDSTIWLMNTKTCRYTALTSPGNVAPGPLVYSPDGKTLAYGDKGSSTAIYLLNTATRKTVKLNGHPEGDGRYFNDVVNSIAYAPDGKTLTAAYSDGSVWIWDIRTGKHTSFPTPSNRSFQGIAYAPGGKTVAAGDQNGATYLWDTTTGKATHLWGASDIIGVDAVAYTPDRRILAVGYDNAIWLWNASDGKVYAKLNLPVGSEGLNSMTLNPAGTLLAAGDQNGRIYLWRINYSSSDSAKAAA